MASEIHSTLTLAAIKVLKPLVRIFLRNGLAYGQFAEIAKQVFEDTARKEFLPKNRKQSDAHIAVVTGLTRKEVKRLRQMKMGTVSNSQEKYNRVTRVIGAWLNDPQFNDSNGNPAALPLDGTDNSFEALVKKYSGDMKTISMLNVLEQTKTVKKNENHIELIKHAYIPSGDSIENLTILGNDCNELLSTIDHNLISHPDELKFQRKASNSNLNQASADAINQILKKKGQSFLEEIDAKMTELEANNNDPNNARRVSIGLYFYDSTVDRQAP